jgi:hypothetical protein
MGPVKVSAWAGSGRRHGHGVVRTIGELAQKLLSGLEEVMVSKADVLSAKHYTTPYMLDQGYRQVRSRRHR